MLCDHELNFFYPSCNFLLSFSYMYIKINNIFLTIGRNVFEFVASIITKKVNLFDGMKIIGWFKHVIIALFIISGVCFVSCSGRNIISVDQKQRLGTYVNSDNAYISEMFFDESMADYGVQPILTRKELNILDALVDRILPSVREQFDQKYTAWLYCWAPLDSLPSSNDVTRQLLKCNGSEFKDLIEFCRQQDDEIFLLLYQLAARAQCPYDQFLLHPVNDLLGSFPEFSKYWREVDLSLQKEKPDLKNRTCNESTIWYTRKILETKYGYTYTNGLTTLFDTRKMLQRNHSEIKSYSASSQLP